MGDESGGRPLRRVLLIDDDRALLDALPRTFTLRLPAVTVESVPSACEALRRLSRARYDLILCDVKMPEMDGIAFLLRVRTVAPQASVVLISGHAEPALREEALRSGAVALIEKPFEREALIRMIRELLGLQDVA